MANFHRYDYDDLEMEAEAVNSCGCLKDKSDDTQKQDKTNVSDVDSIKMSEDEIKHEKYHDKEEKDRNGYYLNAKSESINIKRIRNELEYLCNCYNEYCKCIEGLETELKSNEKMINKYKRQHFGKIKESIKSRFNGYENLENSNYDQIKNKNISIQIAINTKRKAINGISKRMELLNRELKKYQNAENDTENLSKKNCEKCPLFNQCKL